MFRLNNFLNNYSNYTWRTKSCLFQKLYKKKKKKKEQRRVRKMKVNV